MATSGDYSWMRNITPYLVFIVFVTTIGPLQFGYHMVRLTLPDCCYHSVTLVLTAPTRPSSTSPSRSSPASSTTGFVIPLASTRERSSFRRASP